MASLPQHIPPRRARKRGHNQSFGSYLSFGIASTMCMGCFLVTYALVLAFLFPLLETTDSGGNGLENIHIPHAPGQERLVEAASAMRAKLQHIRKGNGVTDESLLNSAKAEFEVMRAKKRDMKKMAQKPLQPIVKQASPAHERDGFVVLGMHRSGTSMLSGLLVTACGYNVGGPLIGAHFDNEKGFFERIDVVLQNDEFMSKQKIDWSAGVRDYDAELALSHKEHGLAQFKEGERALQFLNNPANAPWLQKDPRMCITLKTWLKLLNKEPAVVFTYRHPLEVAMSLKKREREFTLDHGLRLWIMYNMRAIENSQGLCRITSSNEAILENPLKEVQRISDELTSKCGVPHPPDHVTQEDVDKFVDPQLQHNKKKREKEDLERKVLEVHDGCAVHEFATDLPDGPIKERVLGLYMKAMKIYCDFQSGKAYEPGYEWPNLD